MSRLTILGALCLAFGLTACQPAPRVDVPVPAAGAAEQAGLALTTDQTVYAVGADVVLELRNGSGRTWGYNLCPAELERRDGSGVWHAVPPDPERACTLELRTLEPGASATYSHTLPATAQPGVYRFRTGVEDMQTGARHELPSREFEVVG